MKPGKPFLFARLDGRPTARPAGQPFGLPGRLRGLRAAACCSPWRGRWRRTVGTLRLRLAEPASGKPGRARLLWARLTPEARVAPLGRDAAQVRGPALADALLAIGADEGELPAGAEVTAWLLDDVR